MPGQRKRKRKQDEEQRRHADPYAGRERHPVGRFADRAALLQHVRLLHDRHGLGETQLRASVPRTDPGTPASTRPEVLLPPGWTLGPDGTPVPAPPGREAP
ncbi:hypothetical protein [Kitasatospora sp. NPDC088134]|uniref:hypothetical protein n=1 Tax=Kitasatospora sp. NPDC088134 TaxID=3364071 RepID=UPI00380441EA